MNSEFMGIEASLNRAEFRWKWLRLVRHSSVLGIVVCLLLLLFGVLLLGGGVTSKGLAVTFFVLLAVVALMAWAIIIISVMAGAPDRSWLARALEHVDRRFLDRLNTLSFLEQRRGEPRAEAFAVRIAQQTEEVLAQKTPPPPFSSGRSLVYVLAFLVSLAATVLLYHRYSPWGQLLAAQAARVAPRPAPEKPLELASPANSVEAKRLWGEVRITDPGADLKVTKVDVVPLQIEAAASQPLKNVDWFSAVNGATETRHELPPPTARQYAVYQPTIYLDELHLSDWDVMTYYAKASTDQKGSYASDVYFLEVRPFREDILKMPGGEGGKPYQSLNEISSLIHRQEHVIRQTYQHVQNPPSEEALQNQDRKKLSEAETDLGDSARHLYAKMAAEMENKPIGEALDNLAKAEQSLGMAGKRLLENVMPQAQRHERSALSELIAARKMFQKAVSDNPGAFGQPQQDEPTPVAHSAKQLSHMAEFRNEAKAAQDFVRKTLDQQRSLEQQAGSASRWNYARLGAQEQQLQKALQDFQGQHPQVFKGTEAESQQAQQAMAKAADSLQHRRPEARAATQQATQGLEKLSQAMQNQSSEQQLADAYKLKQMLDHQIQQLDQAAKSGGQSLGQDPAQTAKDARQTIDQLQRAAEEEPTRDAFGKPLRDALSGENKMDLDIKLAQVQQAQDQAAKQQRAGAARDALSNVSKAFEQSQPKALQSADKTDSLKPAEKDSLNQGMAELDSLIKQLERNPQPSPQDQAKQGRQALYDLQTGLRSLYGNNSRGSRTLLHLKQALQGEAPLDPANLKQLLEELQRFSAETAAQLAKKEDQPELANSDPTRFPPAYRGRIQRYFERLSER